MKLRRIILNPNEELHQAIKTAAAINDESVNQFCLITLSQDKLVRKAKGLNKRRRDEVRSN